MEVRRFQHNLKKNLFIVSCSQREFPALGRSESPPHPQMLEQRLVSLVWGIPMACRLC